MRRLTFTRLARDDRGAVAVVVALVMVVLIGFVAISVDVGRLYVERRQLQNGADAVALAIAQDCGTPTVTAQAACLAALAVRTPTSSVLAGRNANDGRANARVLPHAAADPVNSVRVQTSTLEADATPALPFFFAPVLGNDSATVTAESYARWGTPATPVATLPLAVDICHLPDSIVNNVLGGAVNNVVPLFSGEAKTLQTGPNAAVPFPITTLSPLQIVANLLTPGAVQTNVQQTLCWTRQTASTLPAALGINGLPTRTGPGGTLWLQHDSSTCQVTVPSLTRVMQVDTRTGAADPRLHFPTACRGTLSSMVGTTILLPVYALAGAGDDPRRNPATANAVIGPQTLATSLLRGLGYTVSGVIPALTPLVGGPPQAEWVNVVALVGFHVTGYSFPDVGSNSFVPPAGCNAPCYGLNGAFTPTTVLNPLDIGIASLAASSELRFPPTANLQAGVGVVNLGVSVAVLCPGTPTPSRPECT